MVKASKNFRLQSSNGSKRTNKRNASRFMKRIGVRRTKFKKRKKKY